MENYNKTKLVIVFFLAQIFFLKVGSAQPGSGGVTDFNNSQQFLADASGKPLYLKVEYNIEGTPYFPADYSRATLFMKGGKAYKDVKMKFNLNDNTILYTTPDGKEMILVSPIRKIIFADSSSVGTDDDIVFENGFTPVDHQDETSYYQVLDSGQVMLLKYMQVTYHDKKEYGSASIIRVFSESDMWYLRLPDGTMKKIEKGKDAILSLLPSKKEEMTKFIDANDLKCRKESNWKKIISSYNSIVRSF